MTAALLPPNATALERAAADAIGARLATRRRVIAESLAIHRIKGSRASVERAIAAMDLGVVEIVEGNAANRYDGATLYDGTQTYGAASHWAEYRVFAAQRISNAQADLIRASLAATAPVRSHLAALDFTAAPLLYDGAAPYDGSFNYGVA